MVSLSLSCSLPLVHKTTARIETEACIQSVIPPLLGWGDRDTTVTQIRGGITNIIYKLETVHAEDAPVLVRIFGAAETFSTADRERETDIFVQLACAGIAPRLRAVFANGRVESFLHARCITLSQMTDRHVGDGVAISLARMHCFKPRQHESDGSVESKLWPVVQQWARQATALSADGRFAAIGIDVAHLACVILPQLRAYTGDSDIVFAHNDLLAGNIMHDTRTNTIAFVDFEYSAYNYRAFDIGAHFAEAMGGTQDGHVTPDLYPSAAFRSRFCAVYLRHLHGAEASRDHVQQLVDAAERFGLVSHVYWGLWALVQSETPVIDFPYVRFAQQRLHEFSKRWHVIQASRVGNSTSHLDEHTSSHP